MAWMSSFLSFARDERVVLATIGIATLSIVGTMATILTMIRDDCEVSPPEPCTQYITQETEDALQLDTLEKLSRHPTFSVKEIAVRIVCDRALNDAETVTYLLYGITRTDYDERMKSLRALALLTGQTAGKREQYACIRTPGADSGRNRRSVQVEQRHGVFGASEIIGT